MSKKTEFQDNLVSETGNWNVADQFSRIKIMAPIENAEIYEDVARYGQESLLEDFSNSNIPRDELRLKGLNRLIDELIKLAKNAKFAMKKQGTKEDLEKYQILLEKARDKLIPLTHKIVNDVANNSVRIILHEEIFNKVLSKVSDIKSDINSPLNLNSLIFIHREEFDPRQFKERIKDRMVNKG